jgi:cation diffusion facilitator CzcD-associated flavoprotein CzcO
LFADHAQGATAIQAIPHLAAHTAHLYVFQRTPSSVDIRANHPTDPSTWKSAIATKPNWQRERNLNLFAFLTNSTPKPSVNLVNDQWTRFPSYSALIGGPSHTVTPENVAEHVAKMHALDAPRSDRVRKRVEDVVHDVDTARKLQAWYPGWCKRPCFHDEYLPTFNRENVTLVDMDGKGVETMTEKAIVAVGKEWDVDVVIWSTGFLAPGGGVMEKAGIEVKGRGGRTIEENFDGGMATLHGVTSRGFPNLFWAGVRQAGGKTAFVRDRERWRLTTSQPVPIRCSSSNSNPPTSHTSSLKPGENLD